MLFGGILNETPQCRSLQIVLYRTALLVQVQITPNTSTPPEFKRRSVSRAPNSGRLKKKIVVIIITADKQNKSQPKSLVHVVRVRNMILNKSSRVYKQEIGRRKKRKFIHETLQLWPLRCNTKSSKVSRGVVIRSRPAGAGERLTLEILGFLTSVQARCTDRQLGGGSLCWSRCY